MCKHCKKPLSQAEIGMNFVAGSVRNSLSMKSDKDKIQKYVQFYLPKEILSTKYIV